MAEQTNGNILSGKKKFVSYLVGNVMLLVFAFAFRPDSKLVLALLAIINGGYWSVEGGLDIARAITGFLSQKNGK